MPHILQLGESYSALVVDFDRVWCKKLTEALHAEGVQAVECRSAREAVAIAMQRRPDIVFLDLLLPDDAGQVSGGGFLLCDQLHRWDSTIPLVVVTEVDLPDAPLLAEKVGASAYFIKPVASKTLVEQTASLFDSSRKAGGSHSTNSLAQRVSFSCHCGRCFRMCPSRRRERIACPECGEAVSVPA